ncbi:radical SAM protein [Bacillota bacterium LX-D]|nr:radical SAM protein [Bacillota bacterium LX-D]
MYHLAFANEKGQLFEHPHFGPTGRLGDQWVEPLEEELIPLPQGASLTMLPGCLPMGMTAQGQFKAVKHSPFNRKKALAVGALLPQGYSRTLLPGYVREDLGQLPLMGYTAVAFKDGELYAAAVQTDEDDHWNPKYYNTADLAAKVRLKLEKLPKNRILAQLAKCALEYECFTAQNIFYERWEGGLPSSPACNARCMGCISMQPAECCPSPQSRINFKPEVDELVQIAVNHLGDETAIISFGQGCEGEPSLQAQLLAETIRQVREKTDCGTINMNTNGGLTKEILQVIEAGLDAMRVSLISPNPEIYNAYYRPQNYTVQDVAATLKFAAEKGVHTSVNLLTFPGVTDREEEMEGLITFVQENGVKLLQIRNLNIDPDVFLKAIPQPQGETIGITRFLDILHKELPQVGIGNYTKPVVRKVLE